MDPITTGMVAGELVGSPGGNILTFGGGGEGSSPGGLSNKAIGTGIGAAQVIAGAIQRRKAKKLFPDLEDAQQVNMQQELERRANNAMTGAAVSNQMRDLMQSRAGAVRALGKTGDLSQYGQLARIESQKANDLLAQGQQTELQYRSLAKQALDDIVKRRLDLNSAKYAEMKARAERNTQAGYQNMFAGLMSNGGSEDNGGQVAPVATTETYSSDINPYQMDYMNPIKLDSGLTFTPQKIG